MKCLLLCTILLFISSVASAGQTRRYTTTGYGPQIIYVVPLTPTPTRVLPANRGSNALPYNPTFDGGRRACPPQRSTTTSGRTGSQTTRYTAPCIAPLNVNGYPGYGPQMIVNPYVR